MNGIRTVVDGASQTLGRLRYSRLAGSEEDGVAHDKRPVAGRRAILTNPPIKAVILAVVALGLAVITLGSILFYSDADLSIVDIKRPSSNSDKSDSKPISVGINHDLPSGDKRLTVVVPATDPRGDLCKLITSGLASGYPSPVIVNWGLDYKSDFGKHFGPHLSKITGILAYLEEMSLDKVNDEDRLRDDDLVLTLDAFDVWFQLPPEVLISRYYEVNAAANQRLREQYPRKDMPMEQTIVMATQKKCYPPPASGSNLHCEDLPESPLRSDLYGATTDRINTVPDDEVHDIRPRFVNSGVIIGPVGDMKRFFRRVKEKMEVMLGSLDQRIYSDQGIFGEIYGEQELFRKWMRVHPDAVADENEEAVSFMKRDFEFHVGVDFGQTFSETTVFAEVDGEYLELSNKSYIDKRSAELGIQPTRLVSVPQDLDGVAHPLNDPALASDGKSHTWADSSLFADFYLGSVPVITHHNAHKDGMKSRRTEWWDRTWFFPDLRKLVKASLTPSKDSKPKPLATLKTSGGGDLVYWPIGGGEKLLPKIFEAGAKHRKALDTAKLTDLCTVPSDATDDKGSSIAEAKPWYDEVFRDGQGEL